MEIFTPIAILVVSFSLAGMSRRALRPYQEIHDRLTAVTSN